MVHLAPAQRFHPRINKKVSITAGGSLGHFPQGARPDLATQTLKSTY